jgi:hypothetical protein
LGFLVLPVEAGGVGWCRNETGKVLLLCYLTRSIGPTQKRAFLLDLKAFPSDSFTFVCRCGMAVCVCGDRADTEILGINQHMQSAQQMTYLLKHVNS